MKIKDLRDQYSSGIIIGKWGTKNCEMILYDTPGWEEIKNLKVSSKREKRNFTFTVVDPIRPSKTFEEKTIKMKVKIIKKDEK
jgi:hypothetical protein